jgi:RNA polymerase sigma-70 factor (ECF subfamily)
LREQAEQLADLRERIEQLREAANAVSAVLDPGDFAAYVAVRVQDDKLLAASLEQMRIPELALAWACARGDPEALRRFRDAHFQRLRMAASRAGAVGMEDDVAQRVMARLLVPDGERAPAIEKYAGRGSLDAWLEVTAMREARNAIRGLAYAREVARPEDADRLVDGAIDTSADPELESIKRSYRGHFKHAFEHAFSSLDARARTILRLEHLDGLDGARIAALYGVNKATVSRWRASARELLLHATRRIVQNEMHLTPTEFESVMRLIQSQLHVSLARVLREDEESGD